MAGVDVANKIKLGLKKANLALGNGTNAIYLNSKVTTPGTPINPGVVVVTPILLVDAVVRSFSSDLIDNDLIRSGDIELVSNGDVAIKQNDEIDVNGKIYIVKPVDNKNPSNLPLAYISHLRSQ